MRAVSVNGGYLQGYRRKYIMLDSLKYIAGIILMAVIIFVVLTVVLLLVFGAFTSANLIMDWITGGGWNCG